MATRDRTALFLRYREEARALHNGPHLRSRFALSAETELDEFGASNDDDTAALMQEMRAPPEPDWVHLYHDLIGDVAELEKLMNELSVLYAKHLLPTFGDTDSSALEADIRVRSHRLTTMLHTVERKVRGILQRPHSEGQEKDIRRNLQKRFAAPLQELSLAFRKKQKSYLDKLQSQRDVLDTRGEGKAFSGDQLVNVEDTTHVSGFRDRGFEQDQLLLVEQASATADERAQELNRVAANINDLATIVKDLASLVVDQGTVLDRIDYNLEDTKASTNAAVRELRIADRYQRKRHATACILMLAVACGVMSIILILKWTS